MSPLQKTKTEQSNTSKYKLYINYKNKISRINKIKNLYSLKIITF